MIHALNSLIARDHFDTSAYFKPTLQEFTRAGQLLALPRETSSLALYYNQERFDEAGLPAPDKSWTWETLVSRARKLTQGDGPSREWGIYPPTYHGRDLSIVWQNEGDLLSPDRTKSAVLDPRTVEAYQWIFDLMLRAKNAVLADLWSGKRPVDNALQELDKTINQWLAKP